MTEKSNTHIAMGRWMKWVVKQCEFARKMATHIVGQDKRMDKLEERIARLEKQPSIEGESIIKYFQQASDMVAEIYHRMPKIKELRDGEIEIEIPGEKVETE